MMNDSSSENCKDSDIAERAALYLSGAMPEPERKAFEEALAQGRPEYVEHMKRLEGVVDHLVQTVDPAQPDASIRASLLAKIARGARPVTAPPGAKRQQIWRRWQSSADPHALFTLHANEGSWEETGVEGVQVRRLFVDRANNRMTAMFRMAPGTSYPEHIHDGPEECYVLEGDLHVGEELIMRAGDYQRATPGSEHAAQWTQCGCLLLVASSLSDELV
jgi:anti-sigma factor ChrR (cupin superfamily)